MEKDFLNTNGLVDGMIPKGVECPVKDKCGFGACARPICHRPQALEKNFSCGAARFISMVLTMEERKRGKNV